MRPGRALAALALALPWLLGCATVGDLARLPEVDLALRGVEDAHLAGVRLASVRDWRDLRPADLGRLLGAVQDGRLPFDFVAVVGVTNPTPQGIELRLARLDWTLYLEDRETARGQLRQDLLLPSGREVEVPVPVSLDLYRFFQEDARTLFALARRAVGAGGEPVQLRLGVRPTFATPLGAIRYPDEIVLTDRGI